LKSENVLQEKTYSFALRIIKAYKYLVDDKKEYVLSKQLLRCGTSIGANTEEAIGAQSDNDFYAKLSIVYKEARETHYWLRLLRDSDYFEEKQAKSLLMDCDEILKIVASIIITLKAKKEAGNQLGIKN
jgi:four helix bundle protein